MEVKCHRCGRAWNYKGKNRSSGEIIAYTTCPTCRANVKLPK